MHFLLLLYGDEAGEAALSGEQRQAIVAEHIAFSRGLRLGGAYVAGDPVAASDQAAWVRGGKATDGPFVETKEQLGGYYVVECTSRQEAIDLALQVPPSPGAVVEVRPLVQL